MEDPLSLTATTAVPSSSSSVPHFDPSMVQALAQEMMKFFKDKHVEQQPDHVSPSSFAQFAGSHSIASSSASSHLDTCCAVQHSYVGSWIVDTGASDHMTSDLTQLQNLQPLPSPIQVILPDGNLKHVTHAGQICLSSLLIHPVLYVPDFRFNLLLHLNKHHVKVFIRSLKICVSLLKYLPELYNIFR